MLVERTFDSESHMAVNQREQRVVFADTDIGARVKARATLTHDDRASADQFTAKRFHAEHLGLGITPVSRRAAAFFLCHGVYSELPCNCTDLQFSELLAMTLALLIVLATAHLENAHLVVLTMGQHGDRYSCSGHQGCANLEFTAGTDSQHLIQHNFLANVRSDLFYFNFFTRSNAILLASGFYDRVHNDLPRNFVILRTNFRKAHYSNMQRATRMSTQHSLPERPLSTPPSGGFTPALTLIAQEMREVDAVIARRLDSGVPLVGEVCRYIISAGGKRLRPAILLLVCGALGYRGEQRFNLAAVVEFIHTATLLHDDVVDGSSLRRNMATANATFGNPASVLVGDFLYSRAFQMMLDAREPQVMEILAEATNVIAEGEVLQLMNMHDASLDEAAYLRVIRSKTAKLFEASARLGAVLAHSPPEIEQACADYGQALGTAFQVIDDVLDYDGNATEMGKNLGDDLREGKTTLPLIAAMQRGTPAQAQAVRQAIESGDISDLPAIIAIVRATGALDAAKQAAHAEAQRAADAARRLPANTYSSGLLEIALQLTGRRA